MMKLEKRLIGIIILMILALGCVVIYAFIQEQRKYVGEVTVITTTNEGSDGLSFSCYYEGKPLNESGLLNFGEMKPWEEKRINFTVFNDGDVTIQRLRSQIYSEINRYPEYDRIVGIDLKPGESTWLLAILHVQNTANPGNYPLTLIVSATS